MISFEQKKLLGNFLRTDDAALEEVSHIVQLMLPMLRTDSNFAVVGIDSNEVVIAANDTLLKLCGWSPSQVIGKKVSNLMPKNYNNIYRDILNNPFLDSADVLIKSAIGQRMMHETGSIQIIDACIVYHIKDKVGWLIIRQPAWQTDQINPELDGLSVMAQEFRHSTASLTIADATRPDFPLVFANDAFCALTGYAPDEVTGRNCRFLQGPETDRLTVDRMRQSLLEGRQIEVEILNYKKNGTTFWSCVTMIPVRDAEGRLTHFIGTQGDVTERREAERALANQLEIDSRAGLLYSDESFRRLESCLKRSPGDVVAVAAIGVDGLADITAALGYRATETVLSYIRRKLEGVGSPLFVTQLMSNSFGIAYSVPEPREMERYTSEVQAALDVPANVIGLPLRLGHRIGFSTSDADLIVPDRLLSEALMALEATQEPGSSSVRAFDPKMREIGEARFQVAQKLWGAIQDQTLQLHHQPKYGGDRMAVTGVEALCRWKPTSDWVSPGIFIPIAERTGLISPLGAWVLQQSLVEIADFNRAHSTELHVAVNISASQFYDTGLSSYIERTLEKLEVPPSNLVLEITETSVVRDMDKALAVMRGIKKIGVGIALDDFGVGQSSLGNLCKLPVDLLKLDRSFVDAIETDRSVRAIVSAAIGMVNALGRSFVAEGVETVSQLNILQDLGCTEFQGFFLCPPVPVHRLSEKMILRGHSFCNDDLVILH
jgi:PAS domain S-box-containing protein